MTGAGGEVRPDDQPAPPVRLRVAHATATFPPQFTGTALVAYHNALELARRGHDIHVLAPTTELPAGWRDPEAITVHRLPARFRIGNAPLMPELGGRVRAFDLVHLHYPFYFGGEQVAWCCRRAGVPYVVTYHQDVLFRWPMSVAAALHHKLVGSRILHGAEVVMPTTLDYARHSRLRQVPRHRLVEMPNGVDVTAFWPGLDASAIRARLRLDPDRPVVLFVGGLDRPHFFKGLSVLFRALAQLPNAQAVIVGDGDLRPAYERDVASLGLGGRVHFAGRVSAAELPHFFALADVTVLPSITRGEAFGMVLIEAMATGKPVVASRLPGVRAVVDDGRTGLLARIGDPDDLAARLRRLLADPALRAEFGVAGRRKVEARYAWERVGARLEQVYLNVLDAARRRAAPTGLPAAPTSLAVGEPG